MFDATAFVPAGFELLRVERGDLNADGIADALVVATRSAESPEADSAPRALSIVTSRPDGAYALSAVNTGLAACATCGGRFGDGLVLTTIRDGAIVVVNEGGSARYGWSNEYTFKLDADGERWLLRQYRAVVASQPDQKFKRIDQSPADFGDRSFEGLTPEDLPIPKFD
ncbi:hypothetical protein [Silanimonas sp.]|jgi:hypothetical protein|uniref:hypothetical protein n=1 Tax=Silanimonas sp. TaxID=1929290 RepID=UPI0037C9D3BB